MEILYVIGPLFFVFAIYCIIREQMKRSFEIKKFNAMINNINDSTVLEYLEAFRKTRNFGTRYGNQNPQMSMSDKMRQSQGWDAVKSSSNVSQDVKNKMGQLFLKEKIIVKL